MHLDELEFIYYKVHKFYALQNFVPKTTHSYQFQTGKITAIRCITARETNVSRHHWGQIEESPLKPSGLSQHYYIEGFKKGP